MGKNTKTDIAMRVAGLAISIYTLGLAFVLIKVGEGYQGGDVLTEHYRWVLQGIINLF